MAIPPGQLAGTIQQAVTTHATTLLSMLQNLSNSYPLMVDAIQLFCYMMGTIFMYMGIMQSRKIGSPQQSGGSSIGGVAGTLFVGVMLLNLPTTYDYMAGTLFGTTNMSGTNFMEERMGKVDSFGPLGAVLKFVQFVGFVAFVKGWLLVRRSTTGVQDGDITAYRGIIFIAMGVLSIHIDDTLKIVALTFGIHGVEKFLRVM